MRLMISATAAVLLQVAPVHAQTDRVTAQRMCWREAGLALNMALPPSRAEEMESCIAKKMASTVTCTLRREPHDSIPGCFVFNGYSGGAKVGAFRGGTGKAISAGGSCPSDAPVGRLISANKVAVLGKTFTLSGDCRSSTTN